MSRTRSATLVIGAEISNKKGDRVGQVEDLIVDLKNGSVIYSIISFDKAVGTEDKYFPIPVEAIEEDSENGKIILKIGREQLNSAPSFNNKKWPKGYEEEFVQRVYSHYGYNVPDR